MGLVMVGVDIGQKQDPTAIAVSEPIGEIYWVRHLESLDLGMAYPRMAERLAEVVTNVVELLYQRAYRAATRQPGPGGKLIDTKKLRRRAEADVWLLLDATGVGAPVCDMVAEPLADTLVHIQRVMFTYGQRFDGGWGKAEAKLGKGYLVSRLQALLATRRIKMPQTAIAKQLADELLNYEIKVSEDGDDRYGAFKVGQHDDLVTALGLSVLYEEFTGEALWIPNFVYGDDWQWPVSDRDKAASVHADTEAHRKWAKKHYCHLCWLEHQRELQQEQEWGE